MVKKRGIRRCHILLKMRGGNLGNQRVNHRDDIHTRLDVIIRHAHADTVAESEQAGNLVLEIEHIGKEVVAAQMGSQRKRAANQAIKRGGAANGFLHAVHHVEHVGDPAGFLGGDGAVAGDFGRLLVAAVKRVLGDRRRAVVRPGQPAAQAFRLNLQVKNHRLAVRLVQAVDLHQGLKRLARVGQHLGRRISLQPACVYARKRHPRGAFGFLMAQGTE